MVGDKVKIARYYCADKIYVGLEGTIVEEFNDFTNGRRVKVTIPQNDKRYWLGDKPIFPLFCLEAVKESNHESHQN